MDDWEDGPGPFVEYLLEQGLIEADPVAVGVAKQVADTGEALLSDKQKHVLEKYILKPHAVDSCGGGDHGIPWNEMAEAHSRGDGLCSHCRARMDD